MASIASSKVGLISPLTSCFLNVPSMTLFSLLMSKLNIGTIAKLRRMCEGLFVHNILTSFLFLPTKQSTTDPRQLEIPYSPVMACNDRFPKQIIYFTLGRQSNSQSSSPSQCSISDFFTGFLSLGSLPSTTCFLTTKVV